MPNKKISQLDQITSIVGTELVPIVQNGIVKKTTTNSFTGRMKELARAANATAIQDAKEIGRSTLLDGLSAGAVMQQDMQSISAGLHRSPGAVAAMFVYDTSKDSDGGAWTRRCQNTSWYNEPLFGKWLGAQASETNARGYNAALGSELVTNGGFTTSDQTGWTGNATRVINNSQMEITGPLYARAYYTTTTSFATGGKSFKLDITITSKSSNATINVSDFSGGVSVVFMYYPSLGKNTIYFTTPTNFSNSALKFFTSFEGSTSGYITIDDFSIKEVTATSTQANDYYQSTVDGKFYALSKNLLTTTNTLLTQTQWLTAGTYTISSTTASTGSVAISGAATATHTAGGTATTFTVSTSGSVTFTVTGSVTNAQLEVGSVATVYKANTSINRYTEVFRGNKAEFPALVGIVAESSSVTIYDLTESGRPMWMRFLVGRPAAILGGLVSSICMINGILAVAGNNVGLSVINFISDKPIRYSTNTSELTYKGIGLSDRNTAGYGYGTYPPYIGNQVTTSVAMAVFSDSQVDLVTGLKIPLIAVCTTSKISIIKNYSTVYNSQTISFDKVYLTPKLLIASRTSDSTLYYYPNPANISSNFTLLTETSGGVDFNQGNTTALTLKTRSEIIRSSGNKLQLLKNNESSITKGVAATITPTYNTGYMTGDIRRSYLTSVAPGTITSTAYAARGLFLDGTTQGIWLDPSDLGTMYQYSTGSTAVTGVEQQVGLILDKSNGLVLGNNIVKNPGPFINTTEWSPINSANLSVVSDYLRVTAKATDSRAQQMISVTSGNWYRLSYYARPQSASAYGQTYIGTTSGSGNLLIRNETNEGFVSVLFRATTNTVYINLYGSSTNTVNNYSDWNAISVREISGNHAYALTDAARPTLSARYNLLTKTEQFDDAVWTNSNLVTANTHTAPDGTLSADTLTSSGTANYVRQSIAAFSGVQYRLSVSIKYTNNRWVFLQLSDQGDIHRARAWFDVLNGEKGTFAVTGSGVVVDYTITPEGDGWYRCTLVATNPITTLYAYFPLLVTADGVITVAAYGKSVAFWGASLVPADQAGLPYQRVNTATDYDSDITKFPYYLKFSGAQYLQTNSINFNYTDKMFVSAGVRKIGSNAAILSELGTGISGLNGAFAMYAPGGNLDGYQWYFESKGSSLRESWVNSNQYKSPNTKVISGIGSISGNLVALRLDGTQVSENTLDQGISPYGNYPIYIGARSGTTFFFNGQLSQLLIAGKAVTTKQIQDAENYIEQKTYGTYPEFLVDASGNQIVDASGNPLYANVTYQY